MVVVVVHDSKIARLLEGKWIVLRVNALIAASWIGHDNLRGRLFRRRGGAGTGLYVISCTLAYVLVYWCA